MFNTKSWAAWLQAMPGLWAGAALLAWILYAGVQGGSGDDNNQAFLIIAIVLTLVALWRWIVRWNQYGHHYRENVRLYRQRNAR